MSYPFGSHPWEQPENHPGWLPAFEPPVPEVNPDDFLDYSDYQSAIAAARGWRDQQAWLQAQGVVVTSNRNARQTRFLLLLS